MRLEHFTWNSGFGSDVSVAFADINGKMVAKIPVKDSQADLMLSFCMRQSTADNEWANKDGGDHYVTIPAGQSLVKAVFTQERESQRYCHTTQVTRWMELMIRSILLQERYTGSRE